MVLDARAGSVTALEGLDVAGLIGEDRLEAMAVDVAEGQLGAGVGRSRRTSTREPCGQPVRSSPSVSSTT